MNYHAPPPPTQVFAHHHFSLPFYVKLLLIFRLFHLGGVGWYYCMALLVSVALGHGGLQSDCVTEVNVQRAILTKT